MALTKEEWVEWKLHPTTKVVMGLLERRRIATMEEWAQGNLISETESGTKFLMLQAIGACKTIQGILELDETEINGEMSNE